MNNDDPGLYNFNSFKTSQEAIHYYCKNVELIYNCDKNTSAGRFIDWLFELRKFPDSEDVQKPKTTEDMFFNWCSNVGLLPYYKHVNEFNELKEQLRFTYDLLLCGKSDTTFCPQYIFVTVNKLLLTIKYVYNIQLEFKCSTNNILDLLDCIKKCEDAKVNNIEDKLLKEQPKGLIVVREKEKYRYNAIQFTGNNYSEIIEFVGPKNCKVILGEVYINVGKGFDMSIVKNNDWIVCRGNDSIFKFDIFNTTQFEEKFEKVN